MTLMANLVTPATLARSMMWTTPPCWASLSALTTRLISGSAVTAALILASRSFSARASSFQRMVPSFMSWTVLGLSAVPSVARAFGSATFSVCATMYVDATIRMTSNTRTTSTSGVTLIPEMVRARPPMGIVPAISGLRLGLVAVWRGLRLGLHGLAAPAELPGTDWLGLQGGEHDVAECLALLLDVAAALLED